eukprot:7555916-Pyramimonas_sp.AAC.1
MAVSPSAPTRSPFVAPPTLIILSFLPIMKIGAPPGAKDICALFHDDYRFHPFLTADAFLCVSCGRAVRLTWAQSTSEDAISPAAFPAPKSLWARAASSTRA